MISIENAIKLTFVQSNNLTVPAMIKSLKTKDLSIENRKQFCMQLACCFITGTGISKNMQRGLNYLIQAADLGDPDAQLGVASILCSNPSSLTAKQSKKDFKFYIEEAVKNGNLTATYVLSIFLRAGSQGFQLDLKRAVKLLQRGAAGKEKRCMIDLAGCYFSGIEVAEDKKKAYEMYQEILTLHKEYSMYSNLGVCHEHGFGTTQDIKKALIYYRLANDKNEPEGICNLANCYLRGKGVDRDVKKAIELFTKSSNLGYPPAKRTLAMLLTMGHERFEAVEKENEMKLEGEKGEEKKTVKEKVKEQESMDGKTQKATELFQQAALVKDPYSLWMLGKQIFERGHGHDHQAKTMTFQEKKQAVEYFETASKMGLVQAEYFLALCYYQGFGVAKNQKKAYELFQSVDKMGHPLVKYNLALCHLWGVGTEVDFKKAKDYAEPLANTGDFDGKNILSILHRKGGNGIEKNPILAFKILEEIIASDKNDTFPQARVNLAFCYMEGEGVEQDRKRAFEILLALEKKHPSSELYRSIAQCYREGKGVAIDKKRAFEYLKLSLSQGKSNNVVTHLQLAYCYMLGFGTEVQPEDAIKHIRYAANQEHDEAINAWAVLHLIGFGVEKNEQKAFELLNRIIRKNIKKCNRSHDSNLMDENQESNKVRLDAYNNLAWCLWYGLGTKKNQEQAIHYIKMLIQDSQQQPQLQQSQKQSQQTAVRNLAWFYLTGNEAEQALIRKSEIFDSKMLSELIKTNGPTLQLGFCFGPDYSIFEWPNKETDYFPCTHLAWRLKNGNGVDKDEKVAAELYHRSADRGDKIAAHNLALCYEQGIGVPQDLKKAFEYYKISSDLNHPDAQINLASYYLQGEAGIVSEDKKLAFELYKKASSEKIDAIFNMGCCYEYGLGVEIDYSLAHSCYQFALKNGLEAAAIALKKLEERERLGEREVMSCATKNQSQKEFTIAWEKHKKGFTDVIDQGMPGTSVGVSILGTSI